MKIIVVGCGKIGTEILANLVAEGHDVIALDQDPKVLEDIGNIYEVICLCGNGADCEILQEAQVAKADLFVAATASDEMNMLSCFLAKRLGAKNTIARIRNPEYNDSSLGFMRQQLGLSLSVNPERLTAREIFNVLKLPTAEKVEIFSRRNMEIIEVRLGADSPLDGMKISKLRDKYKANFLICAVQRGEEVFIPDGNFELKCGDKIGLTAAPGEINKLLKLMNSLRKQAKNVMILGGSKTAFYLAKMLINIGVSVKIIEKDLQRCEQLSLALPKAVIIQGDGAQQELLLEEGIRSIDAFVALTGMDEENILVSIYSFMQNVPKVVVKVNRDELSTMAGKIGLDCIVSPKEITSNVLISYARALENSKGSNVETLYKIMDGKAEALEFVVHDDVRLTNIPLKKLNLKKNILIAGIMRGRKTIIPSGEDMIMPQDHVIVLASGRRLQDLSDILQ